MYHNFYSSYSWSYCCNVQEKFNKLQQINKYSRNTFMKQPYRTARFSQKATDYIFNTGLWILNAYFNKLQISFLVIERRNILKIDMEVKYKFMWSVSCILSFMAGPNYLETGCGCMNTGTKNNRLTSAPAPSWTTLYISPSSRNPKRCHYIVVLGSLTQAIRGSSQMNVQWRILDLRRGGSI